MNILLIRPGMGDIIKGYNLNDGMMEPLALGVIASLTPTEHKVYLTDDRIEKINYDGDFDLATITVDTYTARRAYQIADQFRDRGVPVVLGGIHVSLLPDEAIHHADSIVIGDAETVWEKLLIDLKNNQLQKIYTGEFRIPQNDRLPNRSIFKGKGYLPISIIQFTRGCPYECSFCSSAAYFNHTQIFRNPESIVEEIKQSNLKFLLFADDNITANPDKAKELFEALIPLKIKWAGQASIEMVKDSELLEMMRRSGCLGQLVGFDAMSKDSLTWLNKKSNLREFTNYQYAIEVLRKYNFQTWASFILGNDYDTLEGIKNTVEFAIKSKFTLAFFHLLSPYPKTQIYEQFKSENRLLYDGKWWLQKDYEYNRAAFIPNHMTPEELSEAVVFANKYFYTFNSIKRRLFDTKTNLHSLFKFLLYLRFNLLIRNTST
ncbi:MAG: B12-binding domain-containing radical SAM protein [Ignavibacteriaceae bacterium]|nr:B12-binding domain-containing radical SAM protein [Ignavibacteriaceae bacterium]